MSRPPQTAITRDVLKMSEAQKEKEIIYTWSNECSLRDTAEI